VLHLDGRLLIYFSVIILNKVNLSFFLKEDDYIRNIVVRICTCIVLLCNVVSHFDGKGKLRVLESEVLVTFLGRGY